MTRRAAAKFFAGVYALLGAFTAPGQFSADSVGVNAGLAKLFGVGGFVASADVQVFDTNRQESLRTPMAVAFLDGKLRAEIDLTRMTGRAVPRASVDAFKQAGLDRVVSIVRPDQKTIHLVFSGVRSYASMEMSPAEAEATQMDLRLQKTALGRETVDGHPCAKQKVTVRNAKGAALLEATTWNATDLKDFPVQIVVPAKDNTTVLRFSRVELGRPPAAQFEPPAGYTKFHSPEMLVLSAAMKQNAPPKAAAPAKPKAAKPGSTTNKK